MPIDRHALTALNPLIPGTAAGLLVVHGICVATEQEHENDSEDHCGAFEIEV